MFWWGSKERAERTDKVNQLYSQKNPGVTIDGETLGWTDYWPRLATQTAGRNAPDVIQMDYRYIFEYARRGALLPLDNYVRQGPQPHRFQRGGDRQRQGRRQDLRRQPRPELTRDGLRQGADRERSA